MSSSNNHNTQTGGLFFNFNNCSKNNDIFLKAYRKGKYESMKFMLDNDMVTDFRHTDRYGNTILHYAVVNEDVEFINYLLDHVKNDKKLLNKGNKKGDTPLHVAVRKGMTEIADVLIERGACPKKKNNDGYYVQRKEMTDEYAKLIPSSKMNFSDVTEGEPHKFLSNLAQKMNRQTVLEETPISPMDIFISDSSTHHSPVQSYSPVRCIKSGKKNSEVNTVSVKDTEDLFNLLNKFNLISDDENVYQFGGAKNKNKINGTRKIFTTLKGKHKSG